MSADAPAEWKYSLYIGQKDKKPAIYEYSYSHKRMTKTSIPLPKGRSHFEVGDFISISSVQYNMARIQYSELRIPDPNIDSLWGIFYYVFVVSPPTTIHIGLKLLEIKPDLKNPGMGRVRLQPMFLLDAENHIKIGKVRTWNSVAQASRRFDSASNASGVTIIGAAYADGISNVFGGASKKIVNTVTRKTVAKTLKASLKRTGKKVLIRRIWMTLKKNPAQYTINAVSAFVNALIKEIKTARQLEEQLKKLSSNKATKTHLGRDIAKPALAKASSAMVLSIITDIIGNQISQGLNEVVKSELEKVILTRLFEATSIGGIELIVNSIADAYAASTNSKKTFEKLLAEELKKKMTDLFKKMLRIDLDKLGATMAS